MSDSITSLVVMDFQRGVVDALGDKAPVAVAARAVEAARANGIPVVFVRLAFRAGLPEVSSSDPQYGQLKSLEAVVTEEAPPAQLHPALGRRLDEPVAVKRRVSAFTGSDLELLLRAAGTTHLVLIGISTGGVVLSTVRQAADLDFQITVLADACADPDPELHQLIVDRILPRQAAITTTDEWIAGLG